MKPLLPVLCHVVHVIILASLLSNITWKKRTKSDVFSHSFVPTVQAKPQHPVSFYPRLFFCHLIGGGKCSCHVVRYISGIKCFLKSAVTSVHLTWQASLISIHHLPKVNVLSCQLQLSVQYRSLFCIFLTLVYGLVSRSLTLLAWTAASVMTSLFRTGLGRLLVCCSLSSSPLLVRPAGDLTHSIY